MTAVPPTPNSVIQNAEALYRRGEYAAAAAILAPLAADPSALRILGLCRLRLGAPAEALDLLSRAYVIAPGDPWTRLHYGIGLQAMGRHDEALPLFRACQSMLPADPAPWLNLATSLLALGDAKGAIAAARKGRLRAPAMPQSHYTLGAALLAGDFLDRAAESFHTATKLAPAFAGAWVNLGVAHYRRGEIAAAEDASRTALRVDPGNQAATTNLATFLRLTGNVEAGESLLRDVIETHAVAAPARINLAGNLLQDGDIEEALALLSGPPPTDQPTRQQWQLQQTLGLIKLGRPNEAREILAAVGTLPPALVPLLRWRLALLALAENDPGQAARHATAMASMLDASPSMLPEHRIMGHYDLAKLWSLLGYPDKAFPQWVKGHRQLARFQPFSRDEYAAFVDATIETFTAGRFADGPRAGNNDSAPVFIVGMPRSGTTLVEQILAAHADVYGAGERHALTQAFTQLGGATETAAAVQRVAGLDAGTLNAAAEQYLARMHRLDPAATRIVDKMPGNFRHLGLAALLLPGAKIIACERDPRDIGLSIFTYRFFGVHAYANDLGDLGWYIGQQRRLMAHWRKILPNPILTLQLRDLVESFHATLATLLDFLGLPYDPACENFHELRRDVRTVSRTQVQEKIHSRGIGRWREYAHHLGPLLAALRDSGSLDDAEI